MKEDENIENMTIQVSRRIVAVHCISLDEQTQKEYPQILLLLEQATSHITTHYHPHYYQIGCHAWQDG